MATLADDEELEDLYRPDSSSSARRSSRAQTAAQSPAHSPASSSSSTGDFAERSRSGRVRASMLRDGYDPQGGYGEGPAGHYDNDDYDEDRDEAAPSGRGRRRAPVSRNGFRQDGRSSLFSSKWGRVGIALAILAIFGVLASAFLLIRGFFLHDARFRIDSAASIQILGNSEISRADLLGVFSSKDGVSDVGRNIFTVPLAQRRSNLEQLPWVQSATVMRLLPNQLRVAIVERVPVAFVREGTTIELVDAGGVILSMPPAMLATRHYSFPVVIGINPGDPAETRADRMQVYENFVSALDSSSAPSGNALSVTTGTVSGTAAKFVTKNGTAPKISQQLSEVDVSDLEDVRALMPSAGTDILVHFGDEDFANRYHVYQQHLPQWRLQYPHLAAIDLRYDRQTVLEMARTASQDPANADGVKVDTTPTLAAASSLPHAQASAKTKPAATSKLVEHVAVRKPAAPFKTPVKVNKIAKPAYALPFDNPHIKHG